MRQKIIRLLEQADLTEAEIRIYLCLLKNGQNTIPFLIFQSGLNQMTVYRAIQRLKKRQLIELKNINQKQSLVIPLSFQALIKKLAANQRKLRHLEIALRNVDHLLPFINLDQESEVEKIEIHQGLEAFRQEYLKMSFLCQHEFLCIGSMPNYWRVSNMSYDCPEERYFIRNRLNRGIYARVLNHPCPEAEEFSKFDVKEKRLTRLSDNLPITQNYLSISENQISHFLCDAQNPRVIVIREPDLVKIYHTQFQHLWKKAQAV